MSDAPVDRLEAALTDLLDGALVSEWVVVVTAIGDDGVPFTDTLAGEASIASHVLGALRFAELMVEDRIRSDNLP